MTGIMKFSLVPLLFLYVIASWEMISCEGSRKMGSEVGGGIESSNSMIPDVTPLFWRRLLEKKDMENENVNLNQIEGELEKKGNQESFATEETEEEPNDMDSELMLPDETDDQNPEIAEGEKKTLEVEQQVDKETKTGVVDKELKKVQEEQQPYKKRNPDSSKLKPELGREGEFETKAIKNGRQDEDKNLQSKVEKKTVTERAADQKVLKEERVDSEMGKLQEEGIANEERQKERKEKEKRNTENRGSGGVILEESDEVQQKTDSKSELTKKGAESVIKLQKDEILSGKGKKEKRRKAKRKAEAINGQGSADKISEDRSGKKVQQKTVSDSQYEENSVESELAEVEGSTMSARKRGKKISDSDLESQTESEVILQGEAEENLGLDLKLKETRKNLKKEGTKVMQKKNKEKPLKEKRREEKSKMVVDEEMEVKKSESDDKISGLVTKEKTVKGEEESLDSAELELLVEVQNRNSKAEKNSKNKAEETFAIINATQKKAKKEKPLKEKEGEEEFKVEIQVVDEDIEGDESKSDGTTAAKAKKRGKNALGVKDLYTSEEKLGDKAERTLDVTSQHVKKQKSSDKSITRLNGKETKAESPLKETRVEEELVQIEEKELKEPESDGTSDEMRTGKKGGKKSLNSDSDTKLVKEKGGDKVGNKAEKSLDAASQNTGKQKNAKKSVTKHNTTQGEKPPKEHAKEVKGEVKSEVESQSLDEGKGMKESKKNGSKDAQQSMVEKIVSTSAQETDDDDDEYGEFLQDFSDLSSKFQDTAQRVAGHLGPNIQKITDRSKVYLNKANQQITESFYPLVGKQYAPFLASVISYGLLLLPLAVVIILFEHIRALLSLQKVLLFVNIYLAAYFAILLLATFIIGLEPMTFFYRNATSSYVHMQLLQALGYIVYLILQTFDVFSSCSSESVAAKLTVVVQWFVAVAVGFHYYVTVFHRAMAMKVPHTSWKIYGIYSLAFSILCLFARIKRTKKEYLQVGQVDSNKKN